MDSDISSIKFSKKPLIVENGLLKVANSLSENPQETYEQVFLNFDVFASKFSDYPSLVTRIFANATCFGKCPNASTLTDIFLSYLAKQERNVLQDLFFITLGVGNLSCDCEDSRKQIHEAREHLLKLLNDNTDEFKAIRKNTLGTLANVTMDFQDIEYVKSSYMYAHIEPSAAQTIVNCCSKMYMEDVKLDFVNSMLCSENPEIQESGLDILLGIPGTCSEVAATQTLCWLTDHISESVQKKARRLVTQTSKTDIVSFIENGCIPVIWQLRSSANIETSKFAQALLAKLRSEMSPTVKKLLMRTLSMDGNEDMRGHIATALVHLCKNGGFQNASVDSVLHMIDSPNGMAPALEFFCAIEAIFSENSPKDIEPQDDGENEKIIEMQRSLNSSNVLKTLEIALKQSDIAVYQTLRNHAFSYLIEDFSHLYKEEANKKDIHRLLRIAAEQALCNV